MRNTHTIDASEKPLGRLAVEIAILLRGKHKPTFVPNKDDGDFVLIKNVEKIKITGKKLKDKEYIHHTGYPGGLKRIKMGDLIAEKGMAHILRRAVWGMLPTNKLRDKMIKRLKYGRS